MPTYRVTDPQSGKTLKLTGDSPPTEQELNDIFSKVGGNQKGFLQKAANFVAPRTSAYLEKSMGKGIQETKDILSGKKTIGQHYKEAFSKENLADTLGLPTKEKLGVAGELTAYMLPGAKYLKGAPVLPALANMAKTGFVRGATLGLTNPENETLGDYASNTAISGTIGGVVEPAIGLAGITLGKVKDFIFGQTDNLTDAASRQIIKQSPSKVVLNEDGKNALATDLTKKLKSGDIKPGNYKSIYDQSTKKLADLEQKIQSNVVSKSTVTSSKTPRTIDFDELSKPVQKLVEDAKDAGKPEKADAILKYLDNLKQRWGESLTEEQALNMRRKVEKDLAESMFRKEASDISSAVTSTQREFGSSIRDWIRANNKKVRDLLLDESTYIQLQTAMEYQMQVAGTAPLTSGTAGGLDIMNLLGKAITSPVRSPNVLSKGVSMSGATDAMSSRMDALSRALPISNYIKGRTIQGLR